MKTNLKKHFSLNQIMSDLQPGGIFSGFQLATAAEVFNLCNSAGIPGAGDYPLSNTAISSLFNLVGTTGNINGEPGIVAMTSTSPQTGLYDAASLYVLGVNGAQEYTVNDNTVYGSGYSSPELGSWLVRNVPESGGPIIYILAATGLAGFRILIRRKAS